MEWDLKMPPWDLAELEQNACEVNLSSVVGSSTARSVDCSVDLKLGGLGDFGLADKWKEQRRGLAAAAAIPAAAASIPAAESSLKRPRAPSSGGGQMVSCLVDGCRNDLSNCREYHRRHKVCEVHSKAPIVLVGGEEQRFCQQCSRFHLLVEFDEIKRSCRKRLDGHNRRRRKPQPESINSGNLFQNHQATRFSSYHQPQIFPTAATDTTWTSIIKSEEVALYRHPHNPPLMHFPFLHEGNTTMEPSAVCQPLLKTISSAGESKIIFSDGLPPVLDSDCALSLLSSSNHTSGINIGHIVPVDRIPLGQHAPSSLQYSTGLDRALENVSSTGFESGHLGTVLISDATEADLHCQNIFNVEGGSDAASHSLHFSWQ